MYKNNTSGYTDGQKTFHPQKGKHSHLQQFCTLALLNRARIFYPIW